MQRLRTLHPERHFTQIPNEALDTLPDLESVGLLAHLLRHRDDFEFDLQKLVATKPGVTRRTASRARAQLISHGYLVIVKFRHDFRGRFSTEVYRSAAPHTDSDLAELASRYTLGTGIQVPIGSDEKGDTIWKKVTITWAQIESWRGTELVTQYGSLEPKTAEAADAA